MPAGVELGVGYVNIVPSVEGFSNKLRAAVDGEALGKRLSADISKGLKLDFGGDTAIDLPTAKLKARAVEAGTGVGQSMGVGITGALRNVLATLGGLFIGRRIFEFGKESFAAYSDLNEATTKAQQVFVTAFDRVNAFASTAAKSIGASKQEALDAAATFGNLFRAMGIGVDTSADMSTKLLQLAGDLASFNNVPTTEALEALQSGLVGETEPLRRFGVNISADRVKLEAFRLGIVKANVDQTQAAARSTALRKAQEKAAEVLKRYGKDSTEYRDAVLGVSTAEAALAKELQGKVPDLDAAQKAQATYSIIMADTALAQGDFARTAEGAANKQRTLTAQWKDFQSSFGKAVEPLGMAVLGSLSTALTGVSDWWTKNGAATLDGIKRASDLVMGMFGPDPAASFAAGVDIVSGKLDEIFGPDKVASFETGAIRVANAVDSVFGPDPATNFEIGATMVTNAVDRAATALDNIFGEDKKASFIAGADVLRTKWDELYGDFENGAIRVADVVGPMFDALGRDLIWVKDNLLEPVRAWIADVFVPQGLQFMSTNLDNVKNIAVDVKDKLTVAFDIVKTTWEGIGTALMWTKDHVVDPVVGAIQTILDKLNALRENPITSAIGRRLGIEGFALGGVVPGAPGQPQLILAHGGETVLPASATASAGVARGGVSVGSITVVGSAQPRETAFALRSELRWLSMVAGGT